MSTTPTYPVEVIGTAGAGKSALLRLMSKNGSAASALRLQDGDMLTSPADALICACPASLNPTELRTELEPIAVQLNRTLTTRSQACAVGAVPVFLVLTQCDLLARPQDTLGDWLERIEAGKLEAEKTLESLLATAQPGSFGTPALHFWATAQQRPVLAGQPAPSLEPFGVSELVQQVTTAAADHGRRRGLQELRLQGVIWLTAGLLLVLLVTASWAWLNPARPGLAAPETPKEWPEGDYLLQGKGVLAAAEKLLRFEDYRPRVASVTEWPRWYLAALGTTSDLKEIRERLVAAKIGQSLTSELQEAEQALRYVQQRAALFGLAGSLPGQPAVLHFPGDAVPFDQVRTQVQERLELLRKHYPDFTLEPLPAPVPLGVAIELHDAAQVSYEKLLEPVRTEIRARVLKLGEGRETPQAWRELADGWLSLQAESELYEWRELAVLLQRLAGRPQPADPITQLGGFLRLPSIALPLERVALQLPPALRAQGDVLTGLRPVDAPLVITRRTEAGELTTLNLLPLSGADRMPGEPDVCLYGVARQNPLVHGRLEFKPGDELTARVKIVDERERKWVLSWPLADSRSQVFSFGLLSQAPRLHQEEETMPSKGEIAFGARLVFSEPQLFELPDLLPQ